MLKDENQSLLCWIDDIRRLTDNNMGSNEWLEAAGLAISVLYDTVGLRHPLAGILDNAIKNGDFNGAFASSRAVVTLYEQGALHSPRNMIAHEIEGDLLDIAEKQLQLAEKSQDLRQQETSTAIAAFLAGAALEDALRRICNSNDIEYEAHRTTISKLQQSLYQPSKQIEVISQSDNKQITAWGDTRNKADHARFPEITYTEVITMVMGVRAFINKYLI